MNIYIMRHGDASYHARLDSQRELTLHGKEQVTQLAVWLKRHHLSAIDHALVSPYVRAQQTLHALEPILPIKLVEVNEQLTPNGSVDLVMEYLTILCNKKINSLLIISHLPFVGHLVTSLCSAAAPPLFATASLAFVTLSKEGIGTYQWMQHIE